MIDLEKFRQERGKSLQDWARYTAVDLQKSLIRKGVGASGDLNFSILYDLIGIAGGDITSILHTFNYYGKFVDMGVGRGQKIEDVKDSRIMYDLLGHGRKPKKWFSITYYAEIQILQEVMAEKYGEQGAAIIKETIQGLYA